MEDLSLYDLANKLNTIEREVRKLEIEYVKVVEEIIKRLPHLKDDANLRLSLIKELRND